MTACRSATSLETRGDRGAEALRSQIWQPGSWGTKTVGGGGVPFKSCNGISVRKHLDIWS